MSIGASFQAPTNGSGVTITSSAVTTVSGSTIIVAVCLSGAAYSGTTFSDFYTNTWTPFGTDLTYASTNIIRMFQSTNITGGAGHTFTFNPNGSGFPAFIGGECRSAPASPTITQARNVDTHSQATPYVSSPISPATNVTLMGFIWTDAPSGTEVDNWAGSFVLGDKQQEIGNANVSITGSMAMNTKGPGTYNTSVTVTGVTTTDSGNVIVSVEETGGAGPVLMGRRFWVNP